MDGNRCMVDLLWNVLLSDWFFRRPGFSGQGLGRDFLPRPEPLPGSRVWRVLVGLKARALEAGTVRAWRGDGCDGA